MADEQAETATATETGATETASTDKATASAETETTETAAQESPIQTIPMTRFKQVNDRMKAAEREAAELRTQLAEKPAAAKAATTVDDPTAGMTQQQAIDYHVKQSLERQMGTTLDDLRTVVETVPETSRTANWQQWESLCSTHELDPKNEELQGIVSGFITNNKMQPAAAVKRAAELLKPAKGKSPEDFNDADSVLSETLTAEMSQSDWVPADKREAAAAARRGHKVPHMSVEQIFKRSAKQKGGNSRS